VPVPIFVGGGCLLGLSLGYGVAYVGRLFNFFFLDALLLGVLGGAILLLIGLWARVRPGSILVIGCIVFALASWAGQRAGEYRFALRTHMRTAVLVLEESGDALNKEEREKVQEEARRFFDRSVKGDSGEKGMWGYMEQQWSRGVLLLRFGGWSQRIPLPLTAVLIGQVLSTLGAFLIAWMIVRRLQWLSVCALCGRPISLPPEGEAEDVEPQAKCQDCLAAADG